jgi:hypothetical protein
MRSLLACVIWIAASALLPMASAHAAIGTIHALAGDVRVMTPSDDRAARVGMEIQEGDSVTTSANAWALLAMLDGASFTLRPSSEVKFNTYRHQPRAAAENRSVLTLSIGSLRAITGAIGRINRGGYQIHTPTATVGVRGTDHETAYVALETGSAADPPGGTYDKVNSGRTTLRNGRSTITIRAGQTGYVSSDGQLPPRILRKAPVFYQTYTGLDREIAPARREFHRRYERDHPRPIQYRSKPDRAARYDQINREINRGYSDPPQSQQDPQKHKAAAGQKHDKQHQKPDAALKHAEPSKHGQKHEQVQPPDAYKPKFEPVVPMGGGQGNNVPGMSTPGQAQGQGHGKR